MLSTNMIVKKSRHIKRFWRERSFSELLFQIKIYKLKENQTSMEFLFKFMGTMDLLFGILIFIIAFLPKQIGLRIGIVALLYFIFKFVLYVGDVATLLDFLIGIYFVIVVFLDIKIVTIISSLYLIQKGLLTLIM